MRFFLKLAYNGSGFLGWQVQPQGITVQGTIEEALSKLLKTPTGITGAGRTDTGVNARMMIAHFDSAELLPDNFVYRLNSMVGKNIAINDVWQVAEDAHARFDAKRRTYHYYVTTEKNPFLYPLTWQAPPRLNFDAMNEAAKYLLGRQDFTSFSKLHTQVKTNICHITEARWEQCDDTTWRFVISADRFLRNMVRAVVGTLVDVGREKISPQEVKTIIERHNRCSAGTSMPPQALYLWEIDY